MENDVAEAVLCPLEKALIPAIFHQLKKILNLLDIGDKPHLSLLRGG